MGGLSIWHWLIVLAIVLVVFGTKKLRNMGSDLGAGVKNFKDAMKAEEVPKQIDPNVSSGQTIDVEAKDKTRS